MTIERYEELTGITVSTSRQALVTAKIGFSQRILESMLGFSLDGTLYNQNEYTEIGKTQTDCPCPDTDLTLDTPDAVTFAYRLYEYNINDKYFMI